jgi:phosphoribosyl 1,2-cyclic phosphodiesterase
MKLIVVGSNSAGNSYILQGKTQSLILECGMPLAKVKEALNFDLSNVVAALVTHNHADHAKYAADYMMAGIDVGASIGTLDTIPIVGTHRMRILKSKSKYQFGEFIVMPFDIVHDAPEPFGYLLKHDECGLVLFVTDTQYLKPTFPGLNQIIIECNFSQAILDSRLDDGNTNTFVRNRVVQSHMSFSTCKDVLRANDLSKVNNIVLIHLSDGNSHAKDFVNEIQGLTGKNVFAAQSGLVIDFNIQPF